MGLIVETTIAASSSRSCGWQGREETLFRVSLGIRKAARIAAHIFAAALAADWNRVMDQELRSACSRPGSWPGDFSSGAPHNEQMVNIDFAGRNYWR